MPILHNKNLKNIKNRPLSVGTIDLGTCGRAYVKWGSWRSVARGQRSEVGVGGQG